MWLIPRRATPRASGAVIALMSISSLISSPALRTGRWLSSGGARSEPPNPTQPNSTQRDAWETDGAGMGLYERLHSYACTYVRMVRDGETGGYVVVLCMYVDPRAEPAYLLPQEPGTRIIQRKLLFYCLPTYIHTSVAALYLGA